MAEITPEALCSVLMKFYCEVKPQDPEKRSNTMPEQQANIYHKNSMCNIRSAINRHIQDIGRSIDIVQDPQFKAANRIFSGILKERMRDGSSRPTSHKEIINDADLKKIHEYLADAPNDPVVLRQFVWYNISIHFVTRGMEFHHQLRLNSFEFVTDEDGQYAKLCHETQQKNCQGGLGSKEAESDKGMYATGGDLCPVAMLQLLIKKTDPNAQMLFNHFINEACQSPDRTMIWYTTKPLAKRTFASFMPDICKRAHVKKYTAHCLRATAIQSMNDVGHEARHIMFMSGHRNESSIRSYNRSVSTVQKKHLSHTLAATATGAGNAHDAALTPANPSSIVLRHDDLPDNNNVTVSQTVTKNNFTSTPGFLSHSTFENSNFYFKS